MVVGRRLVSEPEVPQPMLKRARHETWAAVEKPASPYAGSVAGSFETLLARAQQGDGQAQSGVLKYEYLILAFGAVTEGQLRLRRHFQEFFETHAHDPRMDSMKAVSHAREAFKGNTFESLDTAFWGNFSVPDVRQIKKETLLGLKKDSLKAPQGSFDAKSAREDYDMLTVAFEDPLAHWSDDMVSLIGDYIDPHGTADSDDALGLS